MKSDIARLISAGRFDICYSKCTFDPSRLVYNSNVNGKKLSLFKVLLSNDCKFDCSYCQNAWRKGITCSPGEIVRTFRLMKERGLVSGAFISSAIFSDPDGVMESILETGRRIREFHRGYLHLKVVPGCSEDLIEEAVDLANRVSINLETTCESRMRELSSVKTHKNDILRKLRKMNSYVRRKIRRGYVRSSSTQIIAGLGESDEEILKIMERAYRIGVSRFYISGFVPLKNTPLEGRRRENKKRIANLYRMDALLRLYGFDAGTIKLAMEGGYLREDPKVLVAEKLIEQSANPPDTNFMLEYEMIPGCGKKISSLLRSGKSLLEIKKSGKSIKRISAYLKSQKRLYEFI